jgi:hypothetical protein
MADAYSCNQITPDTGAEAMFRFKEAMKANNWTVPLSSDGSTFSSGSDQITTGSSGAGGLANEKAWFVLREPSGTREFSIQRGTSNTEWRIKYSVTGSYTGSCDATTSSYTADEIVRLGSGTDEAPVFAQLYGTDGGYRFQWGIRTSSPYCFHSFCYPIGGGTVDSVFLHDILQSGSYHPLDVDPSCQLIGYHASYMLDGAYMGVYADPTWVPGSSYTYGVTCWYKKGISGEDYGYVQNCKYVGNGNSGQTLAPTDDGNFVMGLEPYTEVPLPIFFARYSYSYWTPGGPKGWSTLMKWRTVITSRANGDVLETTLPDNTKEYYICAKHVWLPWTSAVTPLQ